MNDILTKIYDDLNGYISNIDLHEGVITVKYKCKSWLGSGQKDLTIRLDDINHCNITVGNCGWINIITDHPILDEYRCPKCDLYICKKSDDAISDYDLLRSFRMNTFGDYEIDKNIFYGGINAFKVGHGLFGKCSDVLATKIISTFSHLEFQTINHNYIVNRSSKMIDFNGKYVICCGISVTEDSAQQVDSAEASTIAVPPSEPSGSPR